LSKALPSTRSAAKASMISSLHRSSFAWFTCATVTRCCRRARHAATGTGIDALGQHDRQARVHAHALHVVDRFEGLERTRQR